MQRIDTQRDELRELNRFAIIGAPAAWSRFLPSSPR